MTSPAHKIFGNSNQRGFWLRYFLNASIRSGLILMSLAGFPALAQTVCTGTPAECIEAQKQLCKDEPAPPNLVVDKSVEVSGVLVDDSEAPFVFENTIIQLRDSKTQRVLLELPVNLKGQFNLGVVAPGSYRLIAALRGKEGNLRRLPLAEQPKLMTCVGEGDCRVEAVQHIHGTDNPIDFCDPK